ncbi:hypothetical protein A2U01_0031228, partial [Trifolium medium]|nr:hypothetical protein [Trifolium medium]
MLRTDGEHIMFNVFEAMQRQEDDSQCYCVEVIEVVEDECKVQTPSLQVERVVVDPIEIQEAEWNQEIEIFLEQLDDDLKETPNVVAKPPELEELPLNWKYVFLGKEGMKPIVISSMFTPLEEEELLGEVEKMNDSLEGELNGMVPVYCLHTLMKDKDFNPDCQDQEIATLTLEDGVKKEAMKSFETGKIDCMPNSLRVYPVGVASKTKCFKQPPRRFIKRKRFKWKIKKEKPKSDSE